MSESNSTGGPRRRGPSRKPGPAAPPTPAFASPAVDWVRRNPKTALAIALGVGLIIGLSPRLRRGVVNGMSKVGELISEA